MKNIKITLFRNVWDKSPMVISLHEYLTRHVGRDVNGVIQRRYRQLLEEGKKREAQDLKKSQECAVFGGVCEGGRGEQYLTEVSGVAGFDLDHVGPRLAELKEKLHLPFVYAVYTTFSGEGLRVVDMGTCDVRLIRGRYLQVASFISRLCAHPCDMQCKDIARASFTAFDPDIWINPGAVEAFPLSPDYLREEAAQEVPASGGPSALPAGAPGREAAGVSVPAGVPVSGAAGNSVPGSAGNSVPEAAGAPYRAGGVLAGILHDFMKNNWGGEGNRNYFFLHLGRHAGFRHLSLPELDELIRLTVDEMRDTEYGAEQIGGRMRWGYDHALKTMAEHPEGKTFKTIKTISKTFSDSLEREYLSEKEGGKDSSGLENLSLIPDEVYQGLPAILAEGITAARSEWERDMLFLSMLANLSGCLPYVEINYADKFCSPHLYFFAIAKAGSGKGVLSLAAHLPRLIQLDFDKENERRQNAYRTELLRWDEHRKKKKEVGGDETEPQEPIRKCILQPAGTSHSRLVRSIAENPLGVIINATELDMLTYSMNQDCGHFDDILRAAFHHEEVSIDYKVDKRKIVAYESRVAGSMGGTYGQFVRFVGNEENGMFSRGMYYTVVQKPRWISAKPRKGRSESTALFRKLSQDVRRMYYFLLESPTNVLLTDEQWKRHDETFSRMLSEVSLEEGTDKESMVYRLGLIACRLMSIFTAMRKYESGWTMKDLYCSDEDFVRAMAIAEVLLEHGMSLSTIFPEQSTKPRQMNYYFKYRVVLGKMPTRFTRADFLKVCVENGVSVATGDRILREAKQDLYLEKEGNMYIKKGHSWYKNMYR